MDRGMDGRETERWREMAETDKDRWTEKQTAERWMDRDKWYSDR